MPTVTNKKTAPLTVPLPGGKKLWLAPLKSGEISTKAVDHPPVQKLVEDGSIEITDSGKRAVDGGAGVKGGKPSSGGSGQGGMRHTGDR